MAKKKRPKGADGAETAADAVVESSAHVPDAVVEPGVVEPDAAVEPAPEPETDAAAEPAAEDLAESVPVAESTDSEPAEDEPAEDEPAAPPVATPGPAIADVSAPRPVLHSRRAFTGRVWDVATDLVNLGEAGVHGRDYVSHPGAVAIAVLNEEGAIYLVRQYRHPVRMELWELPAGLLDVRGEDPLEAAKRELHEEADLIAARWDVLADYLTSPGGSSEGIRIYLARGLTDVHADDRHEREAEEADMEGRWVPLASALAGITRGDLQSPTLVTGALALDAAIRAEFTTLRPADAAWRRPPARGEH